jgi:hypothetical protein
MKPGKLVIALGAVFLLMGAQAAKAAPHAQPKVNSASETLHAAKPQPRASKSKVRAQKLPVQHDATLDYPQLG